jgi:hypothetical protein
VCGQGGEYHDDSIACRGVVGTFATVLTHCTMTTIGKRYLERTKGKDDQRVLDTRTRSVLNAVLSEKRGKALE